MSLWKVPDAETSEFMNTFLELAWWSKRKASPYQCTMYDLRKNIKMIVMTNDTFNIINVVDLQQFVQMHYSSFIEKPFKSL